IITLTQRTTTARSRHCIDDSGAIPLVTKFAGVGRERRTRSRHPKHDHSSNCRHRIPSAAVS
ncbi:hypothetical protein E4U54_006329, partial [Claviceps lovelessii]